MINKKRELNEKKFGSWRELPDGGRKNFNRVKGHRQWTARYVKEVDIEENTIRFYQEIYNQRGELVEIHQKYPEDTGHRKIKEG